MDKRVKQEDREEQVNYLKSALNLGGFAVPYTDTYYIKSIFDKVLELGGNFSIRDVTEIQVKYEEKWKEYFENHDGDS